jgi:hypothetical protein
LQNIGKKNTLSCGNLMEGGYTSKAGQVFVGEHLRNVPILEEIGR